MKIKQTFEVSRSLSEVWSFFKDIPQVAGCLPGAEYHGTGDDGKHNGKLSMKVGPFQTNFVGVAEVVFDEAVHEISLTGKGVDKKGSSRGKMSMVCKLQANTDNTTATVDADVQLSGSIAQIGRVGLIEEIANVLVADFVQNVETALMLIDGDKLEDTDHDPVRVQTSNAVSGFGLFVRAFRAWIRSLFKKAD